MRKNYLVSVCRNDFGVEDYDGKGRPVRIDGPARGASDAVKLSYWGDTAEGSKRGAAQGGVGSGQSGRVCRYSGGTSENPHTGYRNKCALRTAGC